MKNKKTLIVAIGIFVLVLILGIWKWKNIQKSKVVQQNSTEEQIAQPQQQNKEEKKEFVVDVDLDVNNWQTKETEFFTVKFPKEWYWLESIITNNPEFDMLKYADIGIFSDIGPTPPLILSDNTEIVITHWGTPTSNAGTPQDSINARFELAKYNYPAVDCGVSNNKTMPFTANCFATYDSQLQRSYYVINNKISLTVTFRMTRDNPVRNEILDKIVGSVVLKQKI